jgi:ATP-dependent helicase Lhr and Lhr-like helicase
VESLVQEVAAFYASKGWVMQAFQQQTTEALASGQSGILNAPTGSGKTLALMLPFVAQCAKQPQRVKGLQLLWITPIRALAPDLLKVAQELIVFFDLNWEAAIRTGDTTVTQRNQLKKKPAQILITTPESLQLMLSSPEHPVFFEELKLVVVDEWHELMGTKRAVQMELALAYLHSFLPNLLLWGVSATLGNAEQAKEVLLSHWKDQARLWIKSDYKREIEMETLLPKTVTEFPWAGNLGIYHLEQLDAILKRHGSCLVFTNTRAQCEIWYRALLEFNADWAGSIAMHHGSMDHSLRQWVEEALHKGSLRAVICTSSLDLGVDFRPVEAVIQVGSPKGIARFLQRAGRSGHRPGASSKIYYLPTHALEIVEGLATRQAVQAENMEARLPYLRSFDVLQQFMMTLAVADGFYPDSLYALLKDTFSFASLTPEEWDKNLSFLLYGGSLEQYKDYNKVGRDQEGKIRVLNKHLAMRHRLSIGTIVGDSAVQIRYVRGGPLGTVEEWFVGQLNAGDTFWFAGQLLELVRVKANTAWVRKAVKGKAVIPAWMGGRLSFSSELSDQFRKVIDQYRKGPLQGPESERVGEIFALQMQKSHLPSAEELLIEYYQSKEGFHLLLYPFEGRMVHEGLAILLAYRLSKQAPRSISMAVNDYGIELLSEEDFWPQEPIFREMLDTRDLYKDIMSGMNASELTRRRFRDIAIVSGLVFRGLPGKPMKERHLQMGTSLLFNVFRDYEPDNLLYLQAQEETMTFQLEEGRLRQAMKRMSVQTFVFRRPERFSIFSFPIVVDRLRSRLSSEKLEDRIAKMKLEIMNQ